ncbi:Twin-arginine leader-binding protein DmsD [Leminorella richardii]|uniref:Twin-arginine leader-binding protein DmsD n=1 Tax=Leminorella richardii TaxID=158841 RepID=A0A2X4XWN9_9GAMM|nr:molecular chaperone [Leminorella richardii]SQI44475.1 Twin-arginine leader-binding protein DmsD [Leminorella richardii]
MEKPVALMPRILGSLFYYSPDDDRIWTLLTELNALSECYDGWDKQKIEQMCESFSLPERDDAVWQFSSLFEGQGEMVAPPWGSVYLDKDNLLMGETTLDYRRFLAQYGINFVSDVCQPEDQFGLMLLATAQLLESGRASAATTLLEQHLLPWAYRYLEKLADNKISPLYATLAKIAELFLRQVQQDYSLTPPVLRLRF